MNFGLGVAPPEAYIQIAPWEKNRTWEKILRRGSVGSWNWAVGYVSCWQTHLFGVYFVL